MKPIKFKEFAKYPTMDGLFIEHKGTYVHLHHDNVPKELGAFQIWYDSEMDKREYILVNNEVVYLDTLESL